MKSGTKWLILVALVASGGGGFWTWRLRQSSTSEEVYQVQRVERGDLLLAVRATGTVQPENRLVIKPPINGRIERVLTREGEAVRKGQVLATMSSTDRAALLDVARAKGPEELAHWEDIYRPTPIIAPLAGLIITRNVEAGQVITAADPVFSMSDRLIVMAQIDETDLAKVKLGQEVTLALDAYANQPFPGKVQQIAFDARTVNNVTVYDVQISPGQLPDFMRSGMTASVKFKIDERRGVLLLPEAAVHRDGESASVLIASPEPKAPPLNKPVHTGLSDGRQVEILTGLSEGDSVLREVVKLPEAKAMGSPFSPSGPQKKTPAKTAGGR